MKKRGVLCALLLAGTLALSGCSSAQPVESDPENQFYEGDLSVYYLENPALTNELTFFSGAIQRFQQTNPDVNLTVTAFDDAEIMDQQILTELSSGGGPDVILMENGENSIDLLKAAGNGYFYDITDHVEKEKTRHEYYSNAFQAGVVLGRQYILPLSAKTMQLYTTKEKASVYFPNLPEEYTLPQLLNSISSAAAMVEDKEDLMALVYEPWSAESENTFFAEWVRAAGIDFVDMSTNTLAAPKEQIRAIAEFVKSLSQDTKKQERLVELGELVTYEDYIQHGVASMFDRDFFYAHGYMDYYASTFGEQNYFLHVPTFNDPAGYSMQVTYYGVINSHTQNPDAAWGLLQRCVNFTPLNLPSRSGPIQLHVSLSYDLNNATFRWLNGMKNPGGNPLISFDTWVSMRNTFDATANWKLSNAVVDRIVEQAMAPFFSGAKTFDDCFYDMESKLSIYINE